MFSSAGVFTINLLIWAHVYVSSSKNSGFRFPASGCRSLAGDVILATNRPTKKSPRFALAVKLLIAAIVVNATVLTALAFFSSNGETLPVSNGSNEATDSVKASKARAASLYFEDGDVAIFNAKKRVMEKVVETERIYENIFIGGIGVGGLTPAEAASRLEAELQNPLEAKEITFVLETGEIIKSFKDFDAEYAIEEAVEGAYRYARSGSLEERYSLVIALENNPYEITPAYSFDSSKASDIVIQISEACRTAPIEPVLTFNNGEFSVTDEKPGRGADAAKLLNTVSNALAAKTGSRIEIDYVSIPAKYSAAEFMKATALIGTCHTAYKPSDTNRTANLGLAASRINGAVIMPGEVFSTNGHFSPNPSGGNGYLPASAYLQGRIVDSIGGGICQVASTLYVALLYSELEITERTNHSMGVTYLDYAFDATLAGNYIDLKFMNNTGYPVTIESYLSNNNIYVNIYGYEQRPANRAIVFENALLETTQPPAELVTEDASLPSGQKVTDVKARAGHKYRLYKLIYVDGALVEKVQVNTSTYRPVRGESRVGTAPASP